MCSCQQINVSGNWNNLLIKSILVQEIFIGITINGIKKTKKYGN